MPGADAVDPLIYSATDKVAKTTNVDLQSQWPVGLDGETSDPETIVPDPTPEPPASPEPEESEPEPPEPPQDEGGREENPEPAPRRPQQLHARQDEPSERLPPEPKPSQDPTPSRPLGPQSWVADGSGTGWPLEAIQVAVFLAIPAGLAALLAYGPLRSAPLLSLFSHVPKNTALEHPSRRRIHDIVSEKPGICVADVCRLTELSRSAVDYHLDILVRHDLLALRREGKLHHVYARDQSVGRGDRRAYAALRNERCRRIASYVHDNPGSNQSDISSALAIPRSCAHGFLRGLLGSDLLEAHRRGREIRYFPTGRLSTVHVSP